jgi:hypothetical protein
LWQERPCAGRDFHDLVLLIEGPLKGGNIRQKNLSSGLPRGRFGYQDAKIVQLRRHRHQFAVTQLEIADLAN